MGTDRVITTVIGIRFLAPSRFCRPNAGEPDVPGGGIWQPIPVLFGTRVIRQPTWSGNGDVKPPRSRQSSGSGGMRISSPSREKAT